MEADAELELCFTSLSKPRVKALKYPFKWIGTEFSLEDFCRGFVDEEPGDPGNFPNNITEYYWIKEGENDYESWDCLCKLDNGYYAYYTASCDYTGFDCQGEMLMFISKNKERLFYEGMNLITRIQCIKDKERKKRHAIKREKREKGEKEEKQKNVSNVRNATNDLF